MKAWQCGALLVILVVGLFTPFLLQPDCALFSPHSDFISFHYPLRYLLADSVQRFGEFPRWCPYFFCGVPLVGDTCTQWFYPPTWLYLLVSPEDTLRHYGFQVLGHLLLGGLGMVAYLRQRGRSWTACCLGGMVFMLHGKWLAFLLVAQNSMLGWGWLPWVLLSMDRLAQRQSLARVAWLAGQLALLVQGLHPPLIVICAYFLTAYGGVQWLRQPRPRHLLALLAACGLGALLCAATLVPAMEYAGFALRGQGLTLEQAAQGEAPWWLVAYLPSSAFSPLTHGWEFCLYCGAIPWALALMSLRRREQGWWWLAIAVVVLLAAGRSTPFFVAAYHLVPGFSLFRYPTRYGLLLGLLVGVLASRELDRCQQWKVSSRLGVVALLLGLALACQWQLGQAEGWWSLALVAVALAVPAPWRRGALVGLTALELGIFAHSLIDPRPLQPLLHQHALAQQLQPTLGKGRALVSYAQMLTPPYAVHFQIETSNGLTANIPRDSFFLMQEGVGEQTRMPQVVEGIPYFRPKSSAYLRRANITRVLNDGPLELGEGWSGHLSSPFRSYDFLAPEGLSDFPPLWIYEDSRPLARHRLVGQAVTAASAEEAVTRARQLQPEQTVVIEADAVPAAGSSGPQGTVEVEWVNYHRRRLHCRVSGGAYLVISEIFYPGWKLSEGGRPLPLWRGDGYFLCAYLPQGDHSLELDYRPASQPRGLAISGGALLLVLVFALTPRWRATPGGSRRAVAPSVDRAGTCSSDPSAPHLPSQ